MAEVHSARSADTAPLRYHAAIPWIGPIVGATFVGVEDAVEPLLAGHAKSASGTDALKLVPVAGAADPALGRAFAAAFVPVIEKEGRFLRAGADIWLKKADGDRDGWFGIWTKAWRWQGGFDGVLVVLLYNESRELKYFAYDDAFPGQTEVVLASSAKAMRIPASAAGRPWVPLPTPDADLVQRMLDGVVVALEKLLATHTAGELRCGLGRIGDAFVTYPRDSGAAGSSASASDDTRQLVFALASCQYPSAMLEEQVACASYVRLAHCLDAGDVSRRPQCLLLVGDQVYVDGTAGLFDPTARFDRYVRPYEILFRLERLRELTRRLPAFMMLDDHEIVDNWEPRVDDVRPDPALLDGRRSYLRFQRRAGPWPELSVGDSTHPLWCRFAVNGFPFFLADTRTEREARTASSVKSARIMSNAQMLILRRWLEVQQVKHPDVPKFVASPSILLPRHLRAMELDRPASALRADGWDGYPCSFTGLLAFIARRKIRNVIFLSGDEHLSCVARATIAPKNGEPVVIHSVHSSALFAPYPFANSVREDLEADDVFQFVDPRYPERGYECNVETQFADEGDGFAVLRVRNEGGRWTLYCDFDRDRGAVPHPVRFAFDLWSQAAP